MSKGETKKQEVKGRLERFIDEHPGRPLPSKKKDLAQLLGVSRPTLDVYLKEDEDIKRWLQEAKVSTAKGGSPLERENRRLRLKCEALENQLEACRLSHTQLYELVLRHLPLEVLNEIKIDPSE